MTNEVWLQGMARLRACCRDRDMDDAMRQIRAGRYRENLDHLTDKQFLHAVSVLEQREWFPSMEDLARVGSEIPARHPGRGAIEDGEAADRRELESLTPEQRRALFRRGLQLVEEELRKRGNPVSGMIVQTMPSAPGETPL